MVFKNYKLIYAFSHFPEFPTVLIFMIFGLHGLCMGPKTNSTCFEAQMTPTNSRKTLKHFGKALEHLKKNLGIDTFKMLGKHAFRKN